MSWTIDLWRELKRPLLVVGCILLGFMVLVGALIVLLDTAQPFLAVESRSMQHDDSSSAIGIIDTGDVAVASAPWVGGTVRTYVDSIVDGYTSFGDLGDVIVYRSPGHDKPIVHRALVELEYNGRGGFDIPALAEVPPNMWWAPGTAGWWDLRNSVDLMGVGHANVTVHIDLEYMLETMGDSVHGGLITMGDNNWQEVDGARFGIIDQGPIVDVPVPKEWIIGKIVGEVPWLGTIRLWITGTAPDYLPVNSVLALVFSFSSIAALPLVLWSTSVAMGRRRSRDR